jgi:AcrR family transcriptional regulator
MKLKNAKLARGKGRPREFNVDRALDRALRVFWRKGYEGASLPDLTRAMGINRPSVYAAFGNKEALFRKVMDRYAEGPGAYVRLALDAPTARAVVERLFAGGIALMADRANPRGCLSVQGALACGSEARGVQRELVARREEVVELLKRRFERARREGDLPKGARAGDLARYVATVMHGMAVQAAGGASAGELRRVAAVALRAWPRR